MSAVSALRRAGIDASQPCKSILSDSPLLLAARLSLSYFPLADTHSSPCLIGPRVTSARLLACSPPATGWTQRVNFPGGVKDTLKKVARTVVTTMHDEASIWRWPSGPLPFIVLLVYAAILLVWFESHGKGELTVFPHDWAEHLPTREMLGYGILAVIGMHALEGVACCYVLHKRHRFPKKSLPSWFLACMFLGYPVACQVLCIKRADREGKLKHL